MVFVLASVVRIRLVGLVLHLMNLKLAFFPVLHCRASCFGFASPTSFQNCTRSLQAFSAFQRGNMIPRSEWCQQETVCLVSLFFPKLFLYFLCEMRWGKNQIAHDGLQ